MGGRIIRLVGFSACAAFFVLSCLESPRENPIIHPQVVSVSDTSIRINDTLVPVVFWIPANITNKNYFLQTSDSTVLKVRGARLVGISAGVVRAVIASADGGLQDYFNVSVSAPPNPIF